MDRKNFLKTTLTLGALGTISFQHFHNLVDGYNEKSEKMPAFFVGHGSPMNAIEDNEFSRGWKQAIKSIPIPKAILCISAHWETKGTFITAMEQPKTIHDFGGFPKELFEVQYPAKGNPELAIEIKNNFKEHQIELDHNWGLDHGTWSILKQMYPNANIPVLQMSLDYTKPASYHFNLAKELKKLRSKGVLIIGSGNMVHNFQYARFDQLGAHFGTEWALEANELQKKYLLNNDFSKLIEYQNQNTALKLAAPTPEHYLPMLYTIALQENKENIELFNDVVTGGSFSMTSFRIG